MDYTDHTRNALGQAAFAASGEGRAYGLGWADLAPAARQHWISVALAVTDTRQALEQNVPSELLGDEHHIEEAVYVPLKVHAGRWVLDNISATNADLLFSADGTTNEACECDDKRACEQARLAARNLPLPGARELYQLLGEALTA
ncbi:hypothetical protein DI005_20105 [Prauserella sp. PE36]|uniref:hypothetical protein n=1 Tax=Prauserella sp. PE36 TaxID=1504709 RepID=UPI000DE491C7|nr:hypothetical protein [Prauserella sp. PE36]RBM18099.1 hypothetical protein DI005_20105 [Prauserella sp. PE36]